MRLTITDAASVCIPVVDKGQQGYLLIKYQDRGWWFPTTQVYTDENMKDAAVRILKMMLNIDAHPVQGVLSIVTRRQPLMESHKEKATTLQTLFLMNQITPLQLRQSAAELILGTNMQMFTEADMKELEKQPDGLLDKEPLEMAARLRERKPPTCFLSMDTNHDFHPLIFNINLVDEQLLIYAKLLKAASFDIPVQEQLYTRYHELVHPAKRMSLGTFKAFLGTKNITNNHEDYFRSFQLPTPESGSEANMRPIPTHTSTVHYLSFREWLCGLAAMDMHTKHGDIPAEIRCRYIFRYYDKNANGRLEQDELRAMLADIRIAQNQPVNDETMAVALKETYSLFGASGTPIELDPFLQTVGQLKFRGTSHLFRLTVSAVENRGELSRKAMVYSAAERFAARAKQSILKPLVERRDGVYELATHVVRMRKHTGKVHEIHPLWKLADTGAFCDTSQGAIGQLQLGLPSRNMSMAMFDNKGIGYTMLDGLKTHFERENEGKDTEHYRFTWNLPDLSQFGKTFLTLCAQLKLLLLNEPALVRCSSPAYVLGDIHGNYPDLVAFEKNFWRLTPALTSANTVFLGDYVDRGQHGVEVVAYLFAQKIICPDKWFVLRGNHETRSVQTNFHFKAECDKKFGPTLGPKLWEEINHCFDLLPLAAVIDDSIYCVHGGIPSPRHYGGYIQYINNTPKPLPRPQEFPLAQEILWNDPIKPHMLADPKIMADLKANDGFIKNTKRGTACYFSEEALNNFLLRNGLSHVIRAHEVKQTGFQIQLNGKLLTVFSSSRYCSGSNEAACVLVENKKIRLMIMDTANPE